MICLRLKVDTESWSAGFMLSILLHLFDLKHVCVCVREGEGDSFNIYGHWHTPTGDIY